MHRLFGIIFLVLAFSLCTYAQDAKVVQLSDKDARHVLAVWMLKQDAEEKWKEAVKDIGDRYVSDVRMERDSLSLSVGGASPLYLTIGEHYLEMTPCQVRGAEEQVSTEAWKECQAYRAKQFAEKNKIDADRREWEAKNPPHKVYTLKDGWQSGFDFSEGFKFIVPRAPLQIKLDGTNFIRLDKAVMTY